VLLQIPATVVGQRGPKDLAMLSFRGPSIVGGTQLQRFHERIIESPDD
jgi:hypothetical protein